jgi:hypothetical protein
MFGQAFGIDSIMYKKKPSFGSVIQFPYKTGNECDETL